METVKDDKPNENELTVPLNNQTKMIVDDRGLAFVVYVLYLVSYFTGITSIIGVIIAYMQARSANSAIKATIPFR